MGPGDHVNVDDFLVADSFETTGPGHVENYFITHHLANAQGNFYFEAGAVNGFHLSQSSKLESLHNWRGVLVEGHRGFFERLEKGRPNNVCVNAVLGSGDSAWFQEKKRGERLGHSQIKKNFGEDCRRVQTRTVEEILTEANAPRLIDYCVLDVEDGFAEVWAGIDFGRRRFGFLAIEMADPGAKAIVSAMASHGYKVDRVIGAEDYIFLAK
jgi:hypothetical protein